MDVRYMSRDPEVMSGALCFKGTRVPVQNLFDYLEGTSSLEEFLQDFPSVSREAAVAVNKTKGSDPLISLEPVPMRVAGRRSYPRSLESLRITNAKNVRKYARHLRTKHGQSYLISV